MSDNENCHNHKTNGITKNRKTPDNLWRIEAIAVTGNFIVHNFKLTGRLLDKAGLSAMKPP